MLFLPFYNTLHYTIRTTEITIETIRAIPFQPFAVTDYTNIVQHIAILLWSYINEVHCRITGKLHFLTIRTIFNQV